jgi:hypothetical protein
VFAHAANTASAARRCERRNRRASWHAVDAAGISATARNSAPASSARSRSRSSIESPPHSIESAIATSN